MVNTCCAYNCKERFVKGSGITFHHFPRNEALRRKWAILVGRKNFTPTQSSKLCSKHFPRHCFENDAQCQASTIRRITKLKPDAVPSIFNFSIKTSREPPLDHGVKEKQRFPKSEELKNTWLTNIQRENFVPNKYTTLCSNHFTEDSFDTEKFGGHWLKQNAVPTVFDFSKPLRKRRKPHKSEKLDERSSSSKSHSDESNEEPRQDHSSNESKPPDTTRKQTLPTPSRKQRFPKLDDPFNEDKSPRACVVKGCDSHIGDDSKIFYRFPSLIGCNGREFKNLCMLRRSKWIDAVKRGGITKKKFRNERICSNHFITGKPGRMTDKNDPDWVPTLNMGPRNTIQPSVIVHQQQGSNPEMKLLFQNFITELQTTHTAPPIKRKSDCLANNNIDDDTSAKETCKGAKVLYRRPGNKTKKPPITLQKNVDRHKNYSKSRRKEGVSEKTPENAVVDSQMFRCFLCDKHLLVEGASSLSTLTDTTKVPFRCKLDSMVADLVMGVTSNKDGLLCSSCVRVLNHVDCLEDELSSLNKVLLNTLLRKYDLDHVIECTESPNNFIEEVHFKLEQNRTEIHEAEKLTDGSILDLKNATSYLTQVRKTAGKHSHLYNNYLAILKMFKSHSIDTCDVMEKVTDLFKGHPNLIVGFMRFLPSEYIVDVLCNEQANASPLVNEDSLPDASEVSFKLDDDDHYNENEDDHNDYSLSTSFLAQMDEDDNADDSTVCETLFVQSSATKRRAFSGHIYNKSSDQPVKHNDCSYSNDNLAVPLQKNDDSNVVNGVVSPFNHIKNKCESIPSDNLMVPAIKQSKKSIISNISKRITPTIVRVQENADILFGNHLVSVVRPRRKKLRDSQAIESIETEVSKPMSGKFVPGDETSDDFTENSMEAVLQNTNNCIKTLRSELVPTKRQQYYRAKSVVSMSYLDEVKFTFGSESQTYDDFLDIVYKLHTQRMNTPDFIDKLINLFKDHPKLIIEFNKYLPPSYKIEVLGLKPESESDSIISGLKHRVSSELKEDCQIKVITNLQPS